MVRENWRTEDLFIEATGWWQSGTRTGWGAFEQVTNVVLCTVALAVSWTRGFVLQVSPLSSACCWALKTRMPPSCTCCCARPSWLSTCPCWSMGWPCLRRRSCTASWPTSSISRPGAPSLAVAAGLHWKWRKTFPVRKWGQGCSV